MPHPRTTAVSGLIAAAAISPTALACDTGRAGETSVSEIYPTADALPNNLLRFYIYFSDPMRHGGIGSSITLLDGDGQALSGVFLENRRDLWSPDGRRLTLILDPGRVKTGLDAHNALGRALSPGQTYSLVVDQSALDASRCRLSATFIKEFTVTEADYAAPAIEKWAVSEPNAGSHDAVSLRLNGPHDHLSLAHRIRVRDAHGEVIAGAIELADNEERWLFTPHIPWHAESYAITVDTTLEDLAGNRLTGLFDRPATDERISLPVPEYMELAFTPQP